MDIEAGSALRMSVLADGPQASSGSGAQRQAWMQQLEQAWLKQWQAMPAESAQGAAPDKTPAQVLEHKAEHARPSAAPTAGGGVAPQPAASRRIATATLVAHPVHASVELTPDGTAPSSALARRAESREPGHLHAQAPSATPPSTQPLPQRASAQAAGAAPRARPVLAGSAPALPQARPELPASEGVLRWHEDAEGSLQIAMRLPGVGESTAQQAARQLAQALLRQGFARVHLYLNGAEQDLHAGEPLPETPRVNHVQEQAHGHQC